MAVYINCIAITKDLQTMHHFWRNLGFPWLGWPSLRQPQNFIPPPLPLSVLPLYSTRVRAIPDIVSHSFLFWRWGSDLQLFSSLLWFGLSIGKRLGLPPSACAMGGYSTNLTTPAIWTQEFLDLSDSFQRYLTDKLTVCCCPHSKSSPSLGLFRMPFFLHLWTRNICSKDTDTAM